MIRLTIFTPTYNRKKELSKLYDSLQKQSDTRFKWLIVDDGSKDGTEDIIKEFKKDSRFDIIYTYQKNSGKYIAHNKGAELCDTEYFICIDSDDVLEENAVETIYHYMSKMQEKSIGIIFPRKSKENMKNDGWNEIKRFIDIIDLKYIYKIKGETSILIKTKYLREETFPVIENEKFMSEEILYQKLAKHGKLEFVNVPICQFEYKDDGLTRNLFINWSNSFNASILLFKSRYEILNKYKFNIRVINRIKAIINLNALCINNKKKIFDYTPSKLYSIIFFIPAVLWKEMKYGKNR